MHDRPFDQNSTLTRTAATPVGLGQNDVRLICCGVVDYAESLTVMRECHAAVASGLSKPTLMVTEHLPVVTMGNRKLTRDLRFAPGTAPLPPGLSYFEIDRGGSATAHEPGQLVVYPIFPLSFFPSGVRGLVSLLEEAVLLTCKSYGVAASRDALNAGVWCEDRKIAAIGLRVKERVSLHGLAFNVVNSLETFDYIVPCGLHGRTVTSLQKELLRDSGHGLAAVSEGSALTLPEVMKRFLTVLSDVLPAWTEGQLSLPKNTVGPGINRVESTVM